MTNLKSIDMKRSWLSISLALTLALGVVFPESSAQPLHQPFLWQGKALLDWDFEAGDLLGWEANAHLVDVRVSEGHLHSRAVEWDPIMFSPVFEIEAKPWQWIEIRLRSDRAGEAEFFWAPNLDDGHGGFSGGKETRFKVEGDGQWRVYRVTPFWHTEDRLVRLRFDTFAEAAVDVDYIRILEGAVTEPDEIVAAWDFRDPEALAGWFPFDPTDRHTTQVLDISSRGLRFGIEGDRDAALIKSTGDLAVGDNFFVNFRLLSQAGGQGRVIWVSDLFHGLASQRFPVLGDGKSHWYNVDMTSSREWEGRITALGLSVPQGATVSRLSVSQEPEGLPEVEVAYFGPENTVPRKGKPCDLFLSVKARSGRETQNISAELRAPMGTKILGSSAVNIAPFCFGEKGSAQWCVVADPAAVGDPMAVPFEVRLKGRGAPEDAVQTVVEFRDPLDLPNASKVPPPIPARTSYEIGAYYFPGWATSAHWAPILENAPERKPALGWYDEALPEVADWQIKWSVEHGISFYLVDWYWHKGGRHLEHWLHDAYMKSQYRHHLKFALMWANHNPPGSHSLEDWRNVTQYWIDEYFHLDTYYQIDDKPAVFIWNPTGIRQDVGGEGEAAELYALSQRMAREAGYEGVYFAAMSGHQDPASCVRLQREGYEGFTSYHAFECAMKRADNPYWFHFDRVVETSPEVWKEAEDRSSMLYMPVVETGWSSQPWHGARGKVIHSRSAERFRRICQDVKAFADEGGKRIIVLGPLNEWGEGSYIEPCTEFGFDMLDAVREVFCEDSGPHVDLVPTDIGLGPYDLDMRPGTEEPSWSFTSDDRSQGWHAMMGVTESRIVNGVWRIVTATPDPALRSPRLRIDASHYSCLVIRMALKDCPPDTQCQVFWTSNYASSTSEANSVKAAVPADGAFHDVFIPLGKSSRWRGIIKSLRIDPCFTAGVAVEIKSIRFEP